MVSVGLRNPVSVSVEILVSAHLYKKHINKASFEAKEVKFLARKPNKSVEN